MSSAPFQNSENVECYIAENTAQGLMNRELLVGRFDVVQRVARQAYRLWPQAGQRDAHGVGSLLPFYDGMFSETDAVAIGVSRQGQLRLHSSLVRRYAQRCA